MQRPTGPTGWPFFWAGRAGEALIFGTTAKVAENDLA